MLTRDVLKEATVSIPLAALLSKGHGSSLLSLTQPPSSQRPQAIDLFGLWGEAALNDGMTEEEFARLSQLNQEYTALQGMREAREEKEKGERQRPPMPQPSNTQQPTGLRLAPGRALAGPRVEHWGGSRITRSSYGGSVVCNDPSQGGRMPSLAPVRIGDPKWSTGRVVPVCEAADIHAKATRVTLEAMTKDFDLAKFIVLHKE